MYYCHATAYTHHHHYESNLSYPGTVPPKAVWAPRSRSTYVAPAVVSNRSQRCFKGYRTGLLPQTPWSSSHSGDFCTLLLRKVSLALHPQHDMIWYGQTRSLHALRRLAMPVPYHAPVCFVSIGCFCQIRFREHWPVCLRTSTLDRVSSPMPMGVH